MIDNKELMEKAKNAGSKEDLMLMAKENGFDLSEADADKYYNALHKRGEVSDDELDDVAGGACYQDDGRLKVTAYHSCKYFEQNTGYEIGRKIGDTKCCKNCSYCVNYFDLGFGTCNNRNNRRK